MTEQDKASRIIILVLWGLAWFAVGTVVGNPKVITGEPRRVEVFVNWPECQHNRGKIER